MWAYIKDFFPIPETSVKDDYFIQMIKHCETYSIPRIKHVPAQSLSRAQLFVTLWSVGCQASLTMGFFRQEYWSGLPFPPPGALPDPGIELTAPAMTGRFFTTGPPGMPRIKLNGRLQLKCVNARQSFHDSLATI